MMYGAEKKRVSYIRMRQLNIFLLFTFLVTRYRGITPFPC